MELRKETHRGTSVYNGIFNLLILRGARDWMTGKVPQHGDLDDHHIVPQSWGRDSLEPGAAADTILNRTPLTVETNRHVINDRLPNEYLPRLIQENGEEEVRAILESHLISPEAQDILMRDPFTPKDFEEFVGEREHTIQVAIEDMLIKERVDLPSQLKDLDAKVEQIELGIRDLIENALDGESSLLPQHIADKIDERLQQVVKKNASLDSEHYETLHGQLEFFDLRELEDTIQNRGLWSRFQGRFSNKETLKNRFDQLAELRNRLRHSRSVDEVTQKDGEAAILWFQTIFSR